MRLIHRIGRRGLSSAVIEGMQATAARYLAVIDGDLQHDETLLPRMLDALSAIERIFRLREHGTTVRTEMTAGTATFLTMAYIIFVQPAVLSGSQFGFDTGQQRSRQH